MNIKARITVGILFATFSMASFAGDVSRINPPTLKDTSQYGFSQVVIAPSNARTVYLSGQFSGDVSGKVRGKTMQEQIAYSFENLRHAIEAAGAKPENVVKIQVLIVDHEQDYVSLVQSQIQQLFGEHLPASTLIPVPRLALDGMRFEIDATLVIPEK
ncbi:RidA family protein [Pseudomonas sp. REP124]|uniref:RidA family protein n=1 Tax=Pseudomonas sp. REP124 TaxID=2875731 RepID=UPI001CCCEDF1|nr:RidA family protein [Pseudomonas sp. REP124]MBZ9784927.1 RidA family protein [Pseudomonas sp. REP124]